jgi:hypothetical protein
MTPSSRQLEREAKADRSALEVALAHVASREAAAQRNREAFPFAAAKLDEIREFFPEAKIVYAKENGREVGVWREGVQPTL